MILLALILFFVVLPLGALGCILRCAARPVPPPAVDCLICRPSCQCEHCRQDLTVNEFGI